MGRLACEFCGSRSGVRACYSCGTLVCSECVEQVLANKVLCKDCASVGVEEAEESEEIEP